MNLTALQNSPFLQSLGWAIANSLWQTAVLWIAYYFISGLYKNASAKFKNNLSTFLLTAAYLWFCITFLSKYFSTKSLSGSFDVVFYKEYNSPVFYWKNILNGFAEILPYLSAAYLFLLIFLSTKLIRVYRFTSFIKLNGLQKPAVEWKLFTEKAARHIGIAKKIKLWISHHIDVPATIGFLKPVILIPLASVNQLSQQQLEAIILHELSHIKRNDYLINLFISIIETILFFNPFVVLLVKIIKRERENCCDDFVIQYQYDRHSYASALVSLEKFRNTNLNLAIHATSGKKQLLNRIKRIMEVNSSSSFNYGQKIIALILVTGIMFSIAWLSPQNENNDIPKSLINFKKPFDNKIIKDDKKESITQKQNDLTEKFIPLKAFLKKVIPTATADLKELKNINFKEIAIANSRRTNILMQQSNKQLLPNIPLKLNTTKHLFQKNSNFAPLLFDKPTAIYPITAPQINANHLLKEANGFDLQKLQSEFQKISHSFSFNEEQIQNSINNVFTQKQLIQIYQNIKERANDDDYTESVKEIKNSIERKISNRERISRTTKAPGAVHNSFSFFDSITSNKLNSTIKKLKNVRIKTQTPLPPKQTNGYFSYNVANENIPAGVIANTSITQHKGDIRIEYKNGTISINGKVVDVPDTNELLTQFSIKRQKASTPSDKDIIIYIND